MLVYIYDKEVEESKKEHGHQEHAYQYEYDDYESDEALEKEFQEYIAEVDYTIDEDFYRVP